MTAGVNHKDDTDFARELYNNANAPGPAALKWQEHFRLSRIQVHNALRASRRLRDIAGSLKQDGGHTAVFRQILAPPVSQDQFKLMCPSWSKSRENSGRSYTEEAAAEIAAVIAARVDHSLAPWMEGDGKARPLQLAAFVRTAATLMAVQKDATDRRNTLADAQETAVVDLLRANGWTKLPSKLVDERAQVPNKHFMRKTRFATGPDKSKEVDIACGLAKSYVLAMECKVANDPTNAVKRVDEVLNKAKSWKDNWGTYVRTAALLQGVIEPKDVQRLTDAGVHVFWSHDLNKFSQWLEAET